MNKPHIIIGAFKKCIKEFKKNNEPLKAKYFEVILNFLIREVQGEKEIGFLKYFEDYLPTTSNDYFEYIHHTHNPIRNRIHYRYFH